MEAKKIFEKLWSIYTEENPEVLKVYELFKSKGENIVNDHIAFRTFNDPRIDIEVLAKPFTKAGYKEKGQYRFPDKHLIAKHYESETLNARIFISQLKLDDFSKYLQDIIKERVDKIPENTLNSEELIYSGSVWGTPSFKVYEKLKKESEYAAWLYVNGFKANHFTISVNHLKYFNEISEVNDFLKKNGFHLNDSGGEIKGSPGQLLEQSSIKAGLVPVEFTEGTFEIPGCYYEFAKRYKDDHGKYFSGFIAQSADRIFESTDYYKK